MVVLKKKKKKITQRGEEVEGFGRVRIGGGVGDLPRTVG